MEKYGKSLLRIIFVISLILPCHMIPSENPIKLDTYPSWYNPCALKQIYREDPPLKVDRQQEQELYQNILENVQDILLYTDSWKDKMSNEYFKENYDSHLQKLLSQNFFDTMDFNITALIPEFNLTADVIQQGVIPNLSKNSRKVLRSLRVMLQEIAVYLEEITYYKYNDDDAYAEIFYSMFKKLNELLCHVDRTMFSLHIFKRLDVDRSIYPEYKRQENQTPPKERAFAILELYIRGMNYANKVAEYLNRVAQYYAQAEKDS